MPGLNISKCLLGLICIRYNLIDLEHVFRQAGQLGVCGRAHDHSSVCKCVCPQYVKWLVRQPSIRRDRNMCACLCMFAREHKIDEKQKKDMLNWHRLEELNVGQMHDNISFAQYYDGLYV